MKVILHIPTEQYGFIAIEADDLNAHTTAEVYKEYADAFKFQDGFAEKDFNKFVDEYMNTGTIKDGVEAYLKMNDKQKWFFQVLKRHGKRNGYTTTNKE